MPREERMDKWTGQNAQGWTHREGRVCRDRQTGQRDGWTDRQARMCGDRQIYRNTQGKMQKARSIDRRARVCRNRQTGRGTEGKIKRDGRTD